MAKDRSRIRILIADDHAIFRDGLRKLLEEASDISIVGEASNGLECVKMLAKFRPDVLLLDLRMPEKDGWGVLEELNFDSLPTRTRRRPRCYSRYEARRSRPRAKKVC